MIASWIRTYDATHVGATVAALPHNLLLAADGVTPEAPADWIQLPDGNGSTVSIINGAGETVVLTATTVINTWATKVTAITACSGNVTCGTGPVPISITESAAAATSATNAATSATAAASSATTATTQATNAATSATSAAASATTATGTVTTLSTTVITADPAPAVIGTFYDCDPTSAAFNITLPAISSGNHNKSIGINVVTTSAHAVTPVPNGTDTLPANLATVAGTYGRAVLRADNNATPKTWRLVGT